MANVKKEGGSKGVGMISGIIIVACIFVGWSIWQFIMGNGANFEGGINTGHPLPGNYLAMVYKGGPIVPVLLGLLLMVVVFSFERFSVISKAAGKGNLDAFMSSINVSIKEGKIDDAINACDKQQGSVANAVKSALLKYQEVKKEGFTSEEAAETIHKEIEEATTLELPMLEKNLVIVATIVSIGTLVGLIGTVLGMIKAFSALATAGSPDAVALANGISEALVNTALGITTSTVATVAYNYFTSSIDTMTYRIDEAGFSIVQTFASRHNTDGAPRA
jgi:biopolymer transport protein ExbB